MSAGVPVVQVPETLDAWRMVAARRQFEGRVPLSAMDRLAGSLADTEGECRYALEFGRDALQVPYVELSIEAGLTLVCQRSLERFVFPVQTVQRLGLIRDEAEEAALPPGYEALLLVDRCRVELYQRLPPERRPLMGPMPRMDSRVKQSALVRPLDLVQDELVLALPVVPMAPGSEPVERTWSAGEEELQAASPFAALASLKK